MITVQSYLISLGLYRATLQMDPSTLGVWDADDVHHMLRNGDITQERDYLLRDWSPSPITSPWNNGAGYDGDRFLSAIEHSTTRRLAPLREAIGVARCAMSASKSKDDLIRAYRSAAPDAAVEWVDSCQVEMPDGRWLYNPLLGSGGNDARLEFSRNYMRAICAIMDMDTGEPHKNSIAWLDGLLGLSDSPQPDFSIPGGHFFSGDHVNPWLYILALEGCLWFSAGAWRNDAEMKLWPNTAWLTSTGLPGAGQEDEGMELWWPVWRRPVTADGLRALLASQLLYKYGRTIPITGVDYAIAAVTCQRPWLGEVMRVGRFQRNGHTHILVAAESY